MATGKITFQGNFPDGVTGPAVIHNNLRCGFGYGWETGRKAWKVECGKLSVES
jgi:hypothetical protein